MHFNESWNPFKSKVKRIFNKAIVATVVAILGTVGLSYSAVLLMSTDKEPRSVSGIIVYLLLGTIFLLTGIWLFLTTTGGEAVNETETHTNSN